jgi:23S rRNA (uridine2552-2'-O)-methyltransferase
MARSKSSKRWLAEHFDDPYVKMAQQKGLRSRSAFKLQELQEKYHLIKPGMTVVDLGAAPGGWCQVAQPLAGPAGKVFALDILEMEPLPGVEFILGDFTEEDALLQLEQALGEKRVDLVMSDMAPNMSGMAAVDQARAMYLAELALEFVKSHLKPGGDFVVKLFQGADFDAFVRQVRTLFRKVQVIKPKASRPRSKEV